MLKAKFILVNRGSSTYVHIFHLSKKIKSEKEIELILTEVKINTESEYPHMHQKRTRLTFEPGYWSKK